MIMRDKNKTHILTELVEEADSKYLQDLMSGCLPSTADHPIRLAHNAKSIGEIVQALPQEERDKLKDLTADEIGQLFATYRRPRPEKKVTRKRGPISLTKSKD